MAEHIEKSLRLLPVGASQQVTLDGTSRVAAAVSGVVVLSPTVDAFVVTTPAGSGVTVPTDGTAQFVFGGQSYRTEIEPGLRLWVRAVGATAGVLYISPAA